MVSDPIISIPFQGCIFFMSAVYLTLFAGKNWVSQKGVYKKISS